MLVLPFVPVTPIMVILSAGCENQFAPSRASALRQDATCTYCVFCSGSRSQMTTAAPRSSALGINR